MSAPSSLRDVIAEALAEELGEEGDPFDILRDGICVAFRDYLVRGDVRAARVEAGAAAWLVEQDPPRGPVPMLSFRKKKASQVINASDDVLLAQDIEPNADDSP